MSWTELDQLRRRTVVTQLLGERMEWATNEGGAVMDNNRSHMSTLQFDEAVGVTRDAMAIEAVKKKTCVYMLVRDSHERDRNRPLTIPCRDGYGLGGYAKVRDVANDCYLVEGVEVTPLGDLPFAFRLTMPNCAGWGVDLPIPDKVVDKYMVPFFRRQLRELRQKFPRPRYEWHYFQIVACD